jgi:hypothetical protein
VRGDLRAPERLFEVHGVLRSAQQDGDLVEPGAGCRFGQDEPRDLDALAALARRREDLDLLAVRDGERSVDGRARAREEPRLQTPQGRKGGERSERGKTDGERSERGKTDGGQRTLGQRERAAVAGGQTNSGR